MAITTNGKVSITNLQVGTSADLAGIISDESGTGVLAFTTSPTFTTPVLGAATATSVNKVTLTPPATTATLTLAEGSSLITSGAHATTITTTGTTAITLPVTGTLATQADVAAGQVGGVTETGTQTLTNKTLTSPVLGGTTTSASGNVVVKPATNILEVQGDAVSVVGQIQLNCHVNTHGQKIASQPHSEAATNKLTLPGGTTIGNTDAVLVSDIGTQTLTNKTLTAPKFADLGFIADANGNELIILDTVATAVNEVTLANAATLGTPTLTASGTDTNISLDLVPKGTGTIKAGGVNLVTISSTDTLTNKTLTSPTINTATIAGGTLVDAVIRGLKEDVNIVAAAATGTIDFNIETASIQYYTTNATANHTLNFRFSASVSLNTALAVGDAITVVWLNTNGATPFFPNVINIDGSAVTPKVPAAITAGNASAIDAYSFTIIKTASATFTVLETQTKFA